MGQTLHSNEAMARSRTNSFTAVRLAWDVSLDFVEGYVSSSDGCYRE